MHTNTRSLFFAAAVLAMPALAACQPAEQPRKGPAPNAPAPASAPAAAPGADTVYTAGAVKYRVETVVPNVEVPWAICWTPDGRMLFTERAGRVRSFKDGQLTTLHTFKNVRTGGEIGLMGMCLHPQYAANKFVYFAYGWREGNQTDIRVVRLTDSGAGLSDEKIILQGFPTGGNHAGCRIKFGPDGKLYITTGEKFERQLAQDLKSLGGKILRVNDDGTAPDDNPFAGKNAREGVRPEIYAYGNRNPQGIDWQPGTGRLFESEHGPSGESSAPRSGGDEFNFIEAGKNYGWPEIHHDQKKDGMVSPLISWDPATAPASLAFYNGDQFPQWKGSALVGFLGGLQSPDKRRFGICRITLDGEKVASQEMLATDVGRIREVAVGPDGFIYFSTSNKDGRAAPTHRNLPGDDRICRIVPVK